MCGIVGLVVADGSAPGSRLERALPALAHRGPDDHGWTRAGRAGIGMTRLSIVGIATGQQPIASEDGALSIVGNGEIYNAPSLRRELEARGHRFRGESDIEVALHLFEERGPAAVESLAGMFALAILDHHHERIFLARDRLGIKPLFWATGPGGSVIASEIPALRAALTPADIGAEELNPDALREYLRFGYVPAPDTVYRGIRRVPPAHRGWLTAGGVALERWWDLPEPDPGARGVGALAEELEASLTEVVASHTLGDVTAGAFLSGGLDSGTLVALLAGASTRPVPAFTIAFDDPELDESADAARVAHAFGCEHHVEVVPGVELEELEPILRAYGEPCGDVSLLPTHRVARLAARHVKFVLSGDGGDELFAGYSWLLREVRLRRLPMAGAAPWLLPFLSRGQRSRRADFLGKALRTAGDIASGPVHSFLRRRSLCPPHLVEPLLHPRLRRPRRSVRYQQEQWALAHQGNPLQMCLDLDRRFYLPGDILEKVDRASMMHSLEARVPFLDHRIVELAARIPVQVHLGPRGRGKAVLRRVIENVLPPSLLGRPKRGFGIPVDRWLRGPLGAAVRERLLDPGFRQRELVDDTLVRRLLEEHARGYARHGHLLWGLASLAVWAETVDHSAPPAPLPPPLLADRATSARSTSHSG